jgi:hypothetical protein
LTVKLFKDLEFHKWTKKSAVTDAMLCKAAAEIEDGLFDARLGGHLVKKRVAATGRGKRGSYRTIVAYRRGDRLVFLHGFDKNEKDNITRAERSALLRLGDVYMNYSEAAITQIVTSGKLVEVNCNEPNSRECS